MEPVDLSLNKPRSSSSLPANAATTATMTAGVTVNPAPNPAVSQPGLSATPVPSGVQSIGSMVRAENTNKQTHKQQLLMNDFPVRRTSVVIDHALSQVLSPGSILATQGAGGQQILHVIHTIPSVSMPSKVGQLQTIPVVVQSLPVVYTTMPTDGVATAAITVPLIGSDGRSEGSGECVADGGGWGGVGGSRLEVNAVESCVFINM